MERANPDQTAPAAVAGLSAVSPTSFWLDDPAAPTPQPALVDDLTCDLLVVGGGFTGLWTALQAVREDPFRRVVLLEGDRCGGAASGRNGGFVSSSLTHGVANGFAHWPDDMVQLEAMGLENLRGMEQDIHELGLDCEWERTGKLAVATRPHQLAELRHSCELAERAGRKVELLSAEQVRERIHSETFLGGTFDRDGSALVNPARLAWELRRACLERGVTIHERTPVTALRRSGDGVLATTPYAAVQAASVALATNAAPSLLRRLRLFTVPVYDYVLVTAPLTPEQRAAVGWAGREALTDSGNQFHYFRMTADDRILWGGYDAVYYYGSDQGSHRDQRPDTFRILAEQLVTAFPALAGIEFSHAWGGAIDTCTRFAAFYGTAMSGRVSYAMGYTGLGVGATRFGARVMLDLLAGRRTERTELAMVRRKPLPFPPEPARFAVIAQTRASLARADTAGRRDLWLRTLDRFGIGFES